MGGSQWQRDGRGLARDTPRRPGLKWPNMIQIPPTLPEPTATPRRLEGGVVQAVPAVLADKAGVNPGVVLNLPPPVLETPTDGMKPRDATTQPGSTQIDNDVAMPAVRLAIGVGADVEVRQALNTAGLPERLVKLIAQLEQLSDKAGAPVLWPAGEQLKASRPEAALLNLRRALGDSMLFEVKRLQTRLVPSAAQSGVASSDLAASTEPSAFVDGLLVIHLFKRSRIRIKRARNEGSRAKHPSQMKPLSRSPPMLPGKRLLLRARLRRGLRSRAPARRALPKLSKRNWRPRQRSNAERSP